MKMRVCPGILDEPFVPHVPVNALMIPVCLMGRTISLSEQSSSLILPCFAIQ